jgi:hypothetical protein
MIYAVFYYWGPTVLMGAVVVLAMRWVVARYAKLFAMQAENAKAQTAASLQLAQAMERVAAAIEKHGSGNIR